MPFQKGHIPWNKGKKGLQKCSEKRKRYLSKKWKGKKNPFYGKHPKGEFKKGQHISPKTEFKQGKNHPNWKGGTTPENSRIRHTARFKKWREAVYKRDYYTCWICEIIGGKLHPHHLKNFSDYPKLRFKVSNGLTLCEFCHKIYTDWGNKR